MTISGRRLVVTGALLLVGVAASVRAQGIETVSSVPFAFTAGDTKLPQDRYRISPIPGQPSVFMIRGERQWCGAHDPNRSPERSLARAESDLSSLQRSVIPQ